MVTTASKLFLPAALVAFVASWAYGIGTGGELIGVVFLGFKGSVGELAGYTVLTTTAGVLLCLGTASSLLRDADPEVQAATARLEALPPAVAPTTTSYWPILGALSAVVGAVGLVASPVLFVVGALGVLVVTLEWMVTTWSERATGDAEVNRRIRNRLMLPIEIPVFGALGILVLVVSISRILLAVSVDGSWIFAIVLASVIMGGGFVFAYRPNVSRNLVAGVLVVVGLAVIGGGIVAAASGTRSIHPHEEEHELEPAGEGSEG